MISNPLDWKFIKDMKEKLYKSDLLDDPKYINGTMKLHYKGDDRKVYFVQASGQKFIFKTLKCNAADFRAIETYEKEYEIALKMFNTNNEVTPQPLGIRKIEDIPKDRVYFEMLFQYSGISLCSDIFQPDAIEVLLTAQQTAKIFTEVHKANIFHSDIKPNNIVREGDTFKAIDFGVSLSFDEYKQFIETVRSTSKGFRGWTEIFVPPEALRRTKVYKRDKFDVYCWGMTIYQYATRKNDSVLKNEVEIYKMESKRYPYFLNLLDDIHLRDDNEDKVKNFLIPILKLALDENPDKRPVFADISQMLNKGKHLLLQRKSNKLNDEIMKLKEELKKEQNRNVALNDSLLHEKEKQKKLEEICRNNELKFIANLQAKDQELLDTKNALKIRSKECEILKNENEDLKQKLREAENTVKELMKNMQKGNIDSKATKVNSNLNEDQKKFSPEKIIVNEEQKKSPLIKGNNIKKLEKLNVVKENDETFFQCNCTCKMNVTLKCGHMLCFSCVKNAMKYKTKNNCEDENVRCGKCKTGFKIGKFSDTKLIDKVILKCGCICKFKDYENVSENQFDFHLKSKK